ncbi:MAG: class I SAM-dependent methyltransferase [Anaerolineae bacterium]
MCAKENTSSTDRHYGSQWILPGDARTLPFANNTFDVVLLLDVIEHIPLGQQEAIIREIARVLRQGGCLLASIPNLAHLNSRLRFFWRGELHRTASVSKHPGDRPLAEHLSLLQDSGFTILSHQGVTPTVPGVVTWLLWKRPSKFVWLDAWLSRLFPPGLCFTTLIRACLEAS